MHKFITTSLLISTTILFTACNKGPQDPCAAGCTMYEGMAASTFVHFLNGVSQYKDQYGDFYGGDSSIARKTAETQRTLSGDGQWFVIWDDLAGDYKAVSLDYIRELEKNSPVHPQEDSDPEVYADNYYWWSTHDRPNDVARTFRNNVNDGQANGTNFETVNYDEVNDVYIGTITGYEYEDDVQSYDVSLLSAEKENHEKYAKAAAVSSAYQMSLSASLSLVTLADMTARALKSNNGEFTAADARALSQSLGSIAGVSVEEIVKVILQPESKGEVISKIAKNIGTSSANLEQRILPELFGISQ